MSQSALAPSRRRQPGSAAAAPAAAPAALALGRPIVAGTLGDLVAEQIARAILTGELRPGERLGEERVARALGVSRGPVREAARLLSERGLLVQHPRRGFFVRSFTVAEIDDLYDMRAAMERHAVARVLARDDSRAVVATLHAAMQRLTAAAQGGHIGEVARADLAFHRCLIEASGNLRLLKHFDELAGELTILTVLIGRHYETPDYLVSTHEPIVKAIRRRDREAALEAIDAHIRQARDNMCRHFSGAGEARGP